jgi:hypothetical protein
VALSTPHILQNSPQFIVHEFDVCTPRKPILGADEGLLGRNLVLLKDLFLTTEEGHVKMFYNAL